MVETSANLIVTDSQTADYWALHLQMETQTGWKMVPLITREIHLGLSLGKLIPTDSKMVGC